MEVDKATELLAEIAETHRAHLDEYRRNSEKALEMQRLILEAHQAHLAEYREHMSKSIATQDEALATTRRMSALYRRVLAVAAVIVAGLLVYLAWVARLVR